MAKWTYHLADLLTGAVTAEVELTGVRISLRLNAAGTLTGTWVVPTGWSGGSPYTLTTPCRTMVVALRDRKPVFGGVVWTSRPNAENRSVEIGAADWWSLLDHRMVLPVFTPDGTTSQVANLSTTYSQVEQNTIARALVAQAQAHTGGNYGIVVDSTVSGILRDRTYAGHELVDVGTALKQLAEVIDGPDIQFGVATELDSLGRVVKTMRVGTPRLGQAGSAHVFELGANINSYTYERDGTRMVTRQYATGEGIEDGQLIAVAEDTSLYGNGWPLLESEESRNTISADLTLQEHADAGLEASRLPVVVPSLTVNGSGLDSRGNKAFPAVGEVQVGDQVRVVISDWFFSDGFDEQMRVVSLDYTPEGAEEMSVGLNPLLDTLG